MTAPQYQSARDLFEAAREASRDAEYIRRRVERMKASEGVRGASLAPSVSGTKSDVSGTARVNARIDYEAATARRVEEDYALIDLACAVLYGDDSANGVAMLAGPRVADLLWHHYLDDEPWDDAAEAVGMSRATAFREAAKAFDIIDSYGLEFARRGLGMAEG